MCLYRECSHDSAVPLATMDRLRLKINATHISKENLGQTNAINTAQAKTILKTKGSRKDMN